MLDFFKNIFGVNRVKIGAKHILVEQAYEAEDLIKKISNGAKFEELAKDFSMCPSSKNGGDLGIFGKGMMVKAFEEALLSLEVGEISKTPIKTQFGYHLILRTA